MGYNSGGIVIAQVRQVVEAGSMHPLMTEVPGLLVDAVVVCEHDRQFEYGQVTGDLPATTGARRRPGVPDLEPLPLGPARSSPDAGGKRVDQWRGIKIELLHESTRKVDAE